MTTTVGWCSQIICQKIETSSGLGPVKIELVLYTNIHEVVIEDHQLKVVYSASNINIAIIRIWRVCYSVTMAAFSVVD